MTETPKGTDMKNLTQKCILLAALAAAGLLTLSPLNAQSRATDFNIPFQFCAGDTTLPAGAYNLAFDPTANRIVMSSTGLDRAIWILPNRISGRGDDLQTAKITLKFHRYGDTYFLREVWPNGGGEGLSLPVTRAENRAARQGNLRQVALVHPR
jgi:hypothetical protein